MRLTTLVGVGALAVWGARRLQEVAEQEGIPLADLVADLPRRLSDDLATLPDDLRMALTEGRLAAQRQMRALDEQMRAAASADDAA
jgi:hypothetical protein